MKLLKKAAIILSLGMAASAVPAIAHHSFAMFDQSKVVRMNGVEVVQFKWGNPHVFLVVRSEGKLYALECASPAALQASGWRHNSLKAGDIIDVSMYPLRSGRLGGALKDVILPGGRSLGGT